MGSNFYSEYELEKLGIKSFGKNVLISKKASIYGAKNIEIGNNVRIDDFCILSGKIKIGNYVHVAAYSALFGAYEGIELCDFSGLSSRVTIYAASDKYDGSCLTNPTVSEEYKKLDKGKIIVGRHAIVGSSCVVLPSVTINEGTAVGALSLITKSTEEWSVYFGSPAKKIKNRKKDLLKLEKDFLENEK